MLHVIWLQGQSQRKNEFEGRHETGHEERLSCRVHSRVFDWNGISRLYIIIKI